MIKCQIFIIFKLKIFNKNIVINNVKYLCFNNNYLWKPFTKLPSLIDYKKFKFN